MAEGPFPEHYEPFETPLGYNPLNRDEPRATSNPAARVFKSDREAFGQAAQFPHVATTYRLTEHFHYWTKHVRLNAITQPEQFVEIGEALAKELGVAAGDRVRVTSNRGHIEAVAVVTKRIRQLNIDGKKVDTVGIPIHWGFTGVAKPGYLANTLTPFVGDANVQTPEFKAFLVKVEKPEDSHMALQSLDIVRRSATTTPSPGVREPATGTVAKLIDTTKCIGCKACQVACMEWNDLRDEVGTYAGVYENPADLTEHSWTLMRFAEYENPQRRARMADPQGWVHALRGSGLPESLPGARRDRAVLQRHRRFP